MRLRGDIEKAGCTWSQTDRERPGRTLDKVEGGKPRLRADEKESIITMSGTEGMKPNLPELCANGRLSRLKRSNTGGEDPRRLAEKGGVAEPV